MRIGRWCCLAGAAFGVLALIGWITGVGALAGFLPGQPPMMPNTALGLLLTGGAGALRARADAGRMAKAISFLAAGVVLALACATLAEYAFGIDLRIDRALFRAEIGPHPGRPSPLTAVALASLACGLLVFDTRPRARFRPSEWLVFAGGLAAFTALIGYAFGAGPLYRLMQTPVIGVALPTAVGLVLISLGLLLERPEGGVMRVATASGPGSIQLRRLALPAIVIPVVLGIIVIRLSGALGIVELPLAIAIVVATTSVLGIASLLVAAVPLNRAQLLIEQSRAQTRALVEHAPDGVFLADLDGRYTDVNDAGCRLLGCERGELIGKTITELLSPADIPRLWQSKQQLLRGQVHVAEWNLRRKDGTYVPVEVSAKILADGRWQGFVRDITERRRVDDELRQARERIELALQGADLAAWDWNIGSGEVVFNARWAEMRGLRPEEVPGHVDSWLTGIHPDDLPRVKQRVDDCLRGAVPDYECELRVRTQSGQWIWILDRGKVFARNDRGEPTRMVGTELDITARKQVEAELRLAEAKSTGILSISADAIISVDAEQRITMFNEGAERIFGHASAEAIGAPLDILIPARLRAIHRQHVERFAAGNEVARRMGERGATIMGLRKDGTEFPADAAISKLAVGATTILTVTLRDITAQKRVELEQGFLAEVGPALAAGLDYEEVLFNVARLAVRQLADLCIIDLVEDNGDVQRLDVVSRDPAGGWICEALMRSPPDRRRPEPFGAVFEARQSILLREVTAEVIAAWAQNDEQLRALRAAAPTSVIAVPLRAHDALLGVLTLISTSARRFEPADLRLAEELARRISLSIQNSRLYLAARRAIRERDDVVGIVAHDLRNPLSSILLQAKVLAMQAAKTAAPGARDPAGAIERAASRMNRLIQDLLDVTRLEAGHLAIMPARVATSQVVADALDAQRPLAAAAACALHSELGHDVPDVWADRDRVLQVFENLIGNALKFTGANGQVTVGATPRDGEVLLWVADTGCGMTSEEVSHLFDRFWQARKGDRRGAGLGLPIVKGIVEAHGGRLWVESSVGGGSTFFFTLPTAPRSSQHPTQAPPHAS
jgi:PAS domain S-box-containing protein